MSQTDILALQRNGPMCALLLLLLLPFGVLGIVIWVMLCVTTRQEKYTYLSADEFFSEDDINCELQNSGTYTLASVNVLLAPEVIARLNNNKSSYARTSEIAKRILNHTGKPLSNLVTGNEFEIKSKYNSILTEFPCLDFLCLQEVWERPYALILIEYLKKEFSYFLYDIGDYCFSKNFCMLGSGLFFASKKPILDADFNIFTLRTKHARCTSQGVLCVKVLLNYDECGDRHVGYIANMHTQAFQGSEAVLLSQLTDALIFITLFKEQTTQPKDIIDFDIVCGDFNADNMSPADKDVQQHLLFEEYQDVCVAKAGQDMDWAVGTELRQCMLHHLDIMDPDNFRKILVDDSLRRLYVLDADVLVHSTHLMTSIVQPGPEGFVEPLPHGGRRRVDRILYKGSTEIYKIKSLLCVTTGAFGAFSAISIYKGNEIFFDNILMPLVHTLNPETSHKVAIITSKYGFFPRSCYEDPLTLKTQVWQMNFDNPVGIAAGFDKQGEVIEPLHKIGFGFVEIGSVTPVPQPGNEQPRVFRLQKDGAVINRYGFNSDGHEAVCSRLKLLKSKTSFVGIVGVNLGQNKHSEDPVKDYIDGIKKFGDVADYLVINISSPNTPGLRSWQKKQHLEKLLTKLVAARNGLKSSKKPPLLLKLAPDLTQEERKDIADVLKNKKCCIDGLVISNTTIKRMPSLSDRQATEKGGLSGRPLADLSTALIAEMYRLTEGKLPIIGVGGIFSGKDAYDKIKAGASLVQLYTSFIYHGPPRVSRVKQELDELIRSDGWSSVAEAVGKGHSSQK
ncbi:uncharacterized protein LOC110831885 isoform X4 [Zootermopsis nevadensis]|uniref:uncharacterized protein LOC110831885 isoform X4 n=1 Tax=Zootermopsis nevadensis TaxID=136037 RepID=UPI000B8E80B1|nr:uncharacterized protein LOC110831885 isoform X4 [Zootermopsis nevadensis]